MPVSETFPLARFYRCAACGLHKQLPRDADGWEEEARHAKVCPARLTAFASCATLADQTGSARPESLR